MYFQRVCVFEEMTEATSVDPHLQFKKCVRLCVFVRQPARQRRQTSVCADCRWDGVFTDTGSICHTCSSISSLFGALILIGSSAELYLGSLWGKTGLISLCQHIDLLSGVFFFFPFFCREHSSVKNVPSLVTNASLSVFGRDFFFVLHFNFTTCEMHQ